MKIKDMVQTVILMCCLVVIPIFCFSFFSYSKTDLEYCEILDKSFSVALGFFGGATTLAAAYIASKLFNDWKDQHNTQILASEAKETFKLIHEERDFIHQLKFTCEDLSQNKSKEIVSWYSFTLRFESDLLGLFNKNKDLMTSFCFLSQGQEVFNLMISYREEIEKAAKFLSSKKKEPFSYGDLITSESGYQILKLMKDIEIKNEDLLNGLKTYIFVK